MGEVISLHERSRWKDMGTDELLALRKFMNGRQPHDYVVERFYRTATFRMIRERIEQTSNPPTPPTSSA